jgi:hypothetical protein
MQLSLGVHHHSGGRFNFVGHTQPLPVHVCLVQGIVTSPYPRSLLPWQRPAMLGSSDATRGRGMPRDFSCRL